MSEDTKSGMAKVSRIVGGGLIALFCALIIGALALYGIISTNIAHLFMFMAWAVGSLVIWTEIIPGKAPRNKLISVLGLGVVMLAADLTMAHLKKEEPLHSHIDITTLQLHPTEAPPYVQVAYKNAGFIRTKQEILIASTFCRPADPDQKTIDALFAEFLKAFKANDTQGKSINWRPALDPGEGISDQYFANELNGIGVNQLLEEKQWVYFMGGILHSDATGHYRKAVCYVWFSPNTESSINPSKMMENWRSCVPSGVKAWEEAASDDKY
jgi:hypothetical protein